VEELTREIFSRAEAYIKKIRLTWECRSRDRERIHSEGNSGQRLPISTGNRTRRTSGGGLNRFQVQEEKLKTS